VRDPRLTGLRVAVSEDLGFADVDLDVRESFRAAVAVLARVGADLAPAHPEPIDPGPLWDAIALPEGYASEGPLLERSPELVGADAASIIAAGAGATARDYLDAQQARAAFSSVWETFFGSYDLVLTPTMPVTAFAIDRLAPESVEGRPVPETFDAWCALALPANLAGLAAVSIPIGPGRGGLPVGLQIIAPRWGDAVALRFAAAADRALRDVD
jgi:Asp-tRNA(Asn)/Glu-tRNA(Gln) amidotransferase A subunit family amidase